MTLLFLRLRLLNKKLSFSFNLHLLKLSLCLSWYITSHHTLDDDTPLIWYLVWFSKLFYQFLISDCLFNGRLISDGRRFQAPGDRCQQCTCERGNVRCQSSGPCPTLSCTITEQLPGECCPRCKGKSLLMADRCTVISYCKQFLFAIFLFCNLVEINWFSMTYFHNQDLGYLENNLSLIRSENYSWRWSSHEPHENF